MVSCCHYYCRCGWTTAPENSYAKVFLREVCGVNPVGFAPYSVGYVTGLQFEVDAPEGPLVFRSPGHGDASNNARPACWTP